MQEEEIIRLICERNQEGIKEFLRCYGSLILYVVSPILHDEQDREECVSEVAMKVWDKINSYDCAKGSWTVWITVLSRNAALNRVRRGKAAEQAVEIDEHIPTSDPTPEEIVIENERRQALLKELKKLPAKDRELFYRKYYYMQSAEQIGSELGISVRAVEGRLYRIKKKLRKKLGGAENEK